ncbi:MAG TPA: type 4a pilus biogenesis protein PilO [Nitrospirota bacterium]|nr:type 4a pilus biogenesis protein PilO [Nitrospirota bacterium]
MPVWLKWEDRRLRAVLLSFVVLLVLDLILYNTLIAPFATQFSAGEARYRMLRKRHAEAVLFNTQKNAFSGFIAGMPAQKDMPLLVKSLMQTARQLNLSVSSVKYDIPQTSGEFTMLSFSFPAEGQYNNIKRFIYDVETSDRLVGIQELKMDSDKGPVKMEMKLLTYIKGQ